MSNKEGLMALVGGLAVSGSLLIAAPALADEGWGKYVDAGVGKTVSITSTTTTNHFWAHSINQQTIRSNYVGGRQNTMSPNRSGVVFASISTTGIISSQSATAFCPTGSICGLSTGKLE